MLVKLVIVFIILYCIALWVAYTLLTFLARETYFIHNYIENLKIKTITFSRPLKPNQLILIKK